MVPNVGYTYHGGGGFDYLGGGEGAGNSNYFMYFSSVLYFLQLYSLMCQGGIKILEMLRLGITGLNQGYIYSSINFNERTPTVMLH